MAGPKKMIETGKTDDFRRLETHVEEVANGETTERVTTYKQEVVPLEVTKVVKETIVPVITSRKIETYQNGNVVETEHELVPEEALKLVSQELVIKPAELTKVVEEAVRKSLAAQMGQPQLAVAPPAPTPPAPQRFVGFEINSDLLLYSVVALLAAGAVYLTVLKGWILN